MRSLRPTSEPDRLGLTSTPDSEVNVPTPLVRLLLPDDDQPMIPTRPRISKDFNQITEEV